VKLLRKSERTSKFRRQFSDVGVFDDVEVGSRDFVNIHGARQRLPALDQIKLCPPFSDRNAF